MKKILLCLLTLLFLMSLCACTSKQVEEPVQPAEPPVVEQSEEAEPEEPISETALREINIFHLGIRTPLDKKEDYALALAQQLMDLLTNTVDTDSMEAPPESALNPMQVINGHTVLELIYDKDVELPFIVDGEPLTASRLLFSIPFSSSEGALLYTGHELYDEIPLGRLFDQSLQNTIFNSASDQVERVTFSAEGNEVTINEQAYTYEKGDDTTELSGRLLNRILYRAIAFYLNAYTGNIIGLQAMSTNTLYEAVLDAQSGLETDPALGGAVIATFNQYILGDYFRPQTIMAPRQLGEEYQVLFVLNERVTVEINFVMEEDVPLVSALKINMTDMVAEETEEVE